MERISHREVKVEQNNRHTDRGAKSTDLKLVSVWVSLPVVEMVVLRVVV